MDIQLDPVSLPQEQETQVQEQVQGHVLLDKVQEIRLNAGAQGGEEEKQQQTEVQEAVDTSSDTDTGVRQEEQGSREVWRDAATAREKVPAKPSEQEKDKEFGCKGSAQRRVEDRKAGKLSLSITEETPEKSLIELQGD